MINPETIEGYTHSSSEFKSSHDGAKLFRRRWIPESRPRRFMVLQHGFGEHSGRYGHLIEAFRGTHTAFYALDARGHGLSQGKRGHVDQFQQYIDDLGDLIREVRHENDDEKVYLLGHSLGGVIAMQYATQGDNQENLNALMVSACGVYPVLDFVKSVKKFIGQTLASVFPATTVEAGLDVNFISRDEAEVKAYQQDPLVHGKVSFQMGKNFFELGQALLEKVHIIHVPTYLFHGTGDGIIEYRSSQDLYDRMNTPDKTLKLYDDLYHEMMNERKEDRDKVLADLRAWYESH